MPFSFENVSAEVAKGAEDVKKSLEGLISTAEGVDKAFKEMTERQQASLAVAEKFDKAMASSSKALSLFGHSGVTASRGIKSIDVIAKSAASSLGSLGAGSRDAASGFKVLGAEASAFSFDMENAERSIAGLVSGISGLEKRLGGVSGSSIGVNVVVGSLQSLDDLESRIKALPKDVTVNIRTSGDLPKTRTGATGGAQDMPLDLDVEDKKIKAKRNKSWADIADSLVKTYAKTFKKRMSKTLESESDQLDEFKDEFERMGTGRDQVIGLSVKFSEENELSKSLNELEYSDIPGAQEAWKNFYDQVHKDRGDMAKAIQGLTTAFPDIGKSMDKASSKAREAAEELTSTMKDLENQVNREAKTFKDVLTKSMAEGGLEAAKFGDGLGKNATGMLAFGVAAVYVSKKVGELAGKFADAAVGLAKYKTNLAVTESEIIGMSSGGLEAMRKQLSLTREASGDFFEQIKRGVNSLGLTQDQLMNVSSALRETFGGDQTERLKEYLNLLEMIPTLDTDLKITASMDDQSSAIFALAEAGKMNVVMELQDAGLFGGEKKKMPGADATNIAQKTEAVVEGIHDVLLDKLYPEVGHVVSAVVEEASKVAEYGAMALTAIGGLKLMMVAANADNIAVTATGDEAIVAAIYANGSMKGAPPKMPAGGGSMAGLGKNILKVGKGLAVVGVVTAAVGYGFSKLEKHLSDVGDDFGAAGASAAGSATTIAGLAASGAMLGSAFPVIGTALGALAGAAVGLYLEFDNLKESLPKLLGVNSLTTQDLGSEQMAENAAIQKRMQMDLVKSGMELQRSLQMNAHAANNAKDGLYKMQKELADLKIGNLQNMGGSPEAFGSALKDGTIAVEKMYKRQIQDFNKSRRKIMSNQKMDAESRKAALDDLHKLELKATKDFVSATESMIDALFNSPKIIQAGLKSEMSGMMLDFADMGGVGTTEMIAMQDSMVKDLRDKLALTFDAAGKSAKEVADLIEKLNNKRMAQEKDVVESVMDDEKKNADSSNDSRMESAKKELEAARKRRDEEAEAVKQQEANNRSQSTAGGLVASDYGKGQNEGILKARKNALLKTEGEIAAIERETANLVAKRTASVEATAAMKEVMTGAEKKDDKGETYKTADIGKAEKRLAVVKKFNSDLDEQMAKAVDELSESFGAAQVDSIKKASKVLERANSEKSTAVKADAPGKQTPETRAAVKTATEAADKAESDFNEVKSEIGKGLTKILKNGGIVDKKMVDNIVDELSSSEGGLEKARELLAKYPNALEAIDAATKESNNLLGKMQGIQIQKDLYVKQQQVLEKLIGQEDGVSEAMRKSTESVRNILTATKELNDAEKKRLSMISQDVVSAKQAADMYGRVAGAESMVGDGIKARGDVAKSQLSATMKEIEYQKETAKSAEKMLDDARNAGAEITRQRKAAESNYSKMPETTDAEKASKEGQKGIVTWLVAEEKSNASVVSQREQAANEAKNAADKLRESLGQAGSEIEKAFQSLDESVAGVKLKNFEEYAQVLTDTAEYAGSVSQAASQGFEIAKKAAADRLALDKQAAEEGLKADREANESRLKLYMESDATKGVTDPGQLKAISAQKAAELEATTQSKYQLDLGKAELDQKKKVVDAAKRSKDLRNRELDIQQGLIDDAMSFASDFGGSFSSIMQFQQMNVGIARQQLDIAKQTRDYMVEQGVAGVALFEANAEVATKTMALRRKEMGIQKDMMDRLMGSVFGELNSSFGARRQVGSDQALMGVGATRMKTAAGMYTNVPGGKPGTIQERANMRMTSGEGLGGVFGKGQGDVAATGAIGEVMKVLKSAPTKNPLEAKLAEVSAKTADNTEKAAKSLSRGDQPGSFYTHDTTAEAQRTASEGYLAGILGVLKEMAVGVLTGGEAGKGNSDQISKEIAGLASTAKKTASTTEGSGTNLTKSLGLAKKELKNSMTALVVAKKSGKNIEKEKNAVQENLDKVAGLESAIRTREIQNPYAGAAPGIEDYDRVMAGKLPDEVQKLQDIMGDGVAEQKKTSDKTAGQGKMTGKTMGWKTLAGTSDIRSMAGTNQDLRTMKGTSDIGQMTGTDFKSIGGGKTLKNPGAATPRKSTSGGIMAIGGVSTSGDTPTGLGAAQKGVSTDTLANRAASNSVAPQTTGSQVFEALKGGGGGAGGEGSTSGLTCKISGEMMVKFDNKMFKDQVASVMGSLITTPEIAKAIQGVAFR